MSELSEEEARDKVFNDYLYNITKSVRKIRVFYKTTVAQLETTNAALVEALEAVADCDWPNIGPLHTKAIQAATEAIRNAHAAD